MYISKIYIFEFWTKKVRTYYIEIHNLKHLRTLRQRHTELPFLYRYSTISCHKEAEFNWVKPQPQNTAASLITSNQLTMNMP